MEQELTADDVAERAHDELQTSIELENLYRDLCGPSNPVNCDIREHLPALRELAEQCDHVTEFGTRGAVSTVAFLAAQPRKLVCYDLFRTSRVDRVERLAGATEFVFHRQDVLKANIEDTDLLFIDTWHVYDQLKEELRLHAGKVRKYIVLHDTATCGELGDVPGQKGLWPAVEEFLADGEWRVKFRRDNNNGLACLERVVPHSSRRCGESIPNPSLLLTAKMHSPYRAWLADVPLQRQTFGRKTQFVARCTPIRPHGMVSAWWSRAVEGMLWKQATGKGIFMWRDEVGGEVAETRNALVAEVLDFESRTDTHEVSHIFWVDDDVLPMRGALTQLMRHDRDIVTGTYFTKNPDPASDPLLFPLQGHGPCNFIPNRAFEVWGCGMGLTLVKLAVYKRMRDELELPPDRYGRPEWYKTTIDKPGGYTQESDGTIFAGETEDFHFLANAERLGMKPLADTTKHAFGFHFDPANEVGYPEEQWKQYVRGECIRWQTPSGEVAWD